MDPLDTVNEELDLDVERITRSLRRARGLRTAARRALVLARRYREEEGTSGERERACVAQALAWRTAAHDARRAAFSLGGAPGLARTSARPAEADRRTG